MADPLSLDSYVITHPSLLSNKFDIRDEKGNVLFESKPNFMNTDVTITDSAGDVVGEMLHKTFALDGRDFELYEGSAKGGKLLGWVKVPSDLKRAFQRERDLEDQSKTVVASASRGASGTGGTSYSITDSKGKQIAEADTELGDTLISTLGNLVNNAYSLQIKKSGKVSTLMLLEFFLGIVIGAQGKR
jgi:hypothetical protein